MPKSSDLIDPAERKRLRDALRQSDYWKMRMQEVVRLFDGLENKCRELSDMEQVARAAKEGRSDG